MLEIMFADYRKWGKFCWAKLLRYPHYMDFHDNMFTVQGQGAYMVLLEQKIHGENFSRFSKKPRKCESLAQ